MENPTIKTTDLSQNQTGRTFQIEDLKFEGTCQSQSAEPWLQPNFKDRKLKYT